MIEKQYKANLSYQRAAIPVQERVVQDMTSPEHFKKYLGKEKYYHDFLIFWQDLMEEKGWENILNEYVFAGDERADDMLCRLYAGKCSHSTWRYNIDLYNQDSYIPSSI